MDPRTGTVFVANAGDNDVSVIDEATNQVTGAIGVGDGPSAIAVDPTTGNIYVANGT
ncbi:MAG: YncE family protein [Acidimicrobiales bacterium]